jgi:glycosyltransferase involved in cell wall biosynthesis
MAGFTRQYEHARLLNALGWDTRVFATPFDHKRHQFNRPVSWLRPSIERAEEGVQFSWLHTFPYTRNNWRRYVNMVGFCFSAMTAGLFQKPPTVILASSPHLFTGLAGWMLAKRHKVPFVLEVRDLWPESLVQLGLSNKPLIKVLEAIERLLYRRANLIVPLTRGIEAGIRSKGFERKSIALVPNASFRPAPLDEVRRKNLRIDLGWTEKTVAIWIGAHGPANGLDVIVDAARALQDNEQVLFVLVGGGSARAGLISSSRELRNIQFMEPVPKKDVDVILRAADIGILVHRDTQAVKGARPNKLFDYMAAGLPLVINIDGEARSIVEGAGAGIYVAVEDPNALASAVESLSSSPEVRHYYGRSGFQHVSEAHSREDAAATLAQALDRLVNSD